MLQDPSRQRIDMASIHGWSLPRSRRDQPPFFSKSQVISVLEQVGILLQLVGANPFRIRAYQNAARTLSSHESDLWNEIQAGTLTEIKGVGKGIAGLISEALSEGTWGDLESLYERVPKGLIEMLGVPGLGPKRIKQFYDELGIESIAELRSAAEEGALSTLPRMGKKMEEKIIEGIDLLARFTGRRRLDVGLMYGEAFETQVAAISGVQRAQLAGSARRRKESIGDLDVVAAVNLEDAQEVMEALISIPGVAEVKGAGDSKVSLILESTLFEHHNPSTTIDGAVLNALGGDAWEELEANSTIDAQVRLVPPHVFAYTMAYFTGSKEHNVRMRQRALDLGLRLNEFGLFPVDEAGDSKGYEAAKAYGLPSTEESDIYAHLGMKWVPPELREDTGEIEAAMSDKLPNLIEPTQVNGALHNHTTASDGTATLEEMAETAMNLKWQFLGIADHSESLNIGGRSIGIPNEEVAEQGEEIRSLNEKWVDSGVDFRLLHGSECDIFADGKLDYPENVRRNLSHVVGSVHALGSWKNRDEIENTEMLIRAIEDPTFTILGHPTGRIIGGRDGFPVDMHAVLRRMGELNQEGVLKACEINASPYRLDLDWRLCKYAKAQGVPIVINPDAHAPQGLTDVWFGVQIARKGWLESEDILNCLTGAEIEQRMIEGRS
ncbi:MAG: DNA polymerase/3'-5' exonuclease PolX [Candidatus Poseidoniales archaeon]|nr:MAG: DNA polymerase/3'-5' exonuclease PolX [Euryarchaeota archaeon]RCH74033.1 MAG: DNA polymerase/3'-5' exonuclease PolX [Candidatus Poseidoniales archaeon]